MDLYKRRRNDWVAQARSTAGNEVFQSFPDESQQSDTAPARTHRASRHMSAIELARQKFAAAKAAQAKDGKKPKKGGHRTNGSSEKATGLVAQ